MKPTYKNPYGFRVDKKGNQHGFKAEMPKPYCPYCERPAWARGYPYCPSCGGHIDWSEELENDVRRNETAVDGD